MPYPSPARVSPEKETAISEEHPPNNAKRNRRSPRRLGVERRREDREKPGPDAPELIAAGFEFEGGGLWSRDGTFFGKEAALQKACAERAAQHDEGSAISEKDAS